MSFPTPVLTDLSLSSQEIKGLCQDADIAAVTGICHTGSPLMGTLHCHKGDRTVIYQFCRFFGLGWGLRSLHNENTVTPPQRLRLWGTIYLPSWARSGLCTPGPWGKDLGAWLRAEIHFHRGQNQAPDIYMSTLALEILSLLWRSLKPPLLLGAPGTPIHIANKIRFLFTHLEFINQKRRYSHTSDELPLADITWIIVLIQFWWYSWRLNNPSLI